MRCFAPTSSRSCATACSTPIPIPGNVFLVGERIQYLPGRVNRILDRLADNELEVRVDAIDETRLMEGMQKVANRITLGLVLAALISAPRC